MQDTLSTNHRGQLRGLRRGRSRGHGYGRGRGADRPPQRHDRVRYSDCQEPDPDVCDIFIRVWYNSATQHSLRNRLKAHLWPLVLIIIGL